MLFRSGTTTIRTNTTRVLSGQANTLPLKHDFQVGAFVPSTWTLQNDGTNGWKLNSAGGAFGTSTRSGVCNFFNIPVGRIVNMTTNKLDLSLAAGVTTLTFDHAYAYFDDIYFDSLRVDISTNCGQSWKTVFIDGKEGLSTAPPLADGTNAFVPTETEWRSNSIDISDLNGNAEALVRFVGLSGFGNNFYIDNIGVTTTVSVNTVPGLTEASIAPNPTANTSDLRFALEQPQSLSMMVYDMEGSLVQSLHLGDLPAGDHVAPLDATQLPSGSYRVVLQGKTGLSQMQWVVLK